MALPRFSPRQLDAFVTVAELRGFSAAGDRLGLTASAVSQLVSELESTVGYRLFDRTTRKVALSAAGKEFLGSAQTALKHIRLAETAADDIRNRAAGIVRVAAPQAIASHLLPAAIQAFAGSRPNVSIRIRDCPVESLVDMVETGDVDLAIGPDRAVDERVARHRLFDSPWVLWCAPAHPLARLRAVPWSRLHDQPLVAAGRDHERSVSQMRAGLPEGVRVTPVDVVDNTTTALGMAAFGLAVTLTPAYVEAMARPLGLVMRRIVDPEVIRQVCLYQPAQRAISPAAAGFADFVTEWVQHWPSRPIEPGGTRRR